MNSLRRLIKLVITWESSVCSRYSVEESRKKS